MICFYTVILYSVKYCGRTVLRKYIQLGHINFSHDFSSALNWIPLFSNLKFTVTFLLSQYVYCQSCWFPLFCWLCKILSDYLIIIFVMYYWWSYYIHEPRFTSIKNWQQLINVWDSKFENGKFLMTFKFWWVDLEHSLEKIDFNGTFSEGI